LFNCCCKSFHSSLIFAAILIQKANRDSILKKGIGMCLLAKFQRWMMIMAIPTVTLIILMNCSGKVCLGYLTMLITPSIMSQTPNPIRTAERAFNQTRPCSCSLLDRLLNCSQMFHKRVLYQCSRCTSTRVLL